MHSECRIQPMYLNFSELGSHQWWHLQVAEQRLLLLKQREGQNVGLNLSNLLSCQFFSLVTKTSNSVGGI